ncbi:MAG: hypothetical protein Q9198_008563 [Flavoplaca austrocitrina]
MIWLHHLVDNTVTDINIPIWTTKNGSRLTQNYFTEENVKDGQIAGLEDLQEVGRMQFRCQFKAGTDEDHQRFIVDNDSRETYETWEACLAEGVRNQKVTKQLPPKTQELHDQSLTEARDVLKDAEPEEKEKWLSKTGEDWSGAFSHDPKAYMDSKGRKRAEPGKDDPVHHPYNPSSDDDNIDDDSDDSGSDDLGIQDGQNASNENGTDSRSSRSHARSNGGDGESREEEKKREVANKKSEKRKGRGLMQWKPVRNLAFAKDEAKFSMKRIQHKMTGGLNGREPTVETETGQ